MKKFWKKTEGLQKAKSPSSIRSVTFVREKITRALRIQQPSDSFEGRISTSDLFILYTTHQLFISLFRSRHIHINIPANISTALCSRFLLSLTIPPFWIPAKFRVYAFLQFASTSKCIKPGSVSLIKTKFHWGNTDFDQILTFIWFIEVSTLWRPQYMDKNSAFAIQQIGFNSDSTKPCGMCTIPHFHSVAWFSGRL